MVKRLFELLGLLTIAAGVYFVVIERTKVNVCNATAGKYVGFGVTRRASAWSTPTSVVSY